MVAPDGELLDVGDFRAGLESELSEGAVVVKTSHSGEVLSWNAGGIVLADHGVGVGWVADDNSLCGALSVIVDCFTSVDEDLAVIFEEVGTFHSWAAGLSTNKEVVVNIFEGNLEVTSDDDVVEEREGTVVELCLDTLKSVFGVGEIEQVKNDSLVGSEE